MPILTEKTKRLMGVKRGETMTHDVWDKIHGRYMMLLKDLEPILEEASDLRSEIQSYDADSDLMERLHELSHGIVTNLGNASSLDPEGGIWWILQHPRAFLDE